MKVALMTYEGKLHKLAEWNNELEGKGMYARFRGTDEDHYTAVLMIRPEDVEEYEKTCKQIKDKIDELNHELIMFKTKMHHKLIPL